MKHSSRLIAALENDVEMLLRWVIVYVRIIDDDSVDAIVGATHAKNLVEIGGLAVDRLEMGRVSLAHPDGVERHLLKRIADVEHK
jgi:hypothetical protein